MLKQLDLAEYRPANDAAYPRGRFGKAMLEIAQLIKADVGVQLAFADVTGWDTHVNQGASEGLLATRLGEFGQALAASRPGLERTPRAPARTHRGASPAVPRSRPGREACPTPSRPRTPAAPRRRP